MSYLASVTSPLSSLSLTPSSAAFFFLNKRVMPHQYIWPILDGDGDWGDWGSWGRCTMRSGGCGRVRMRRCINLPCTGEAFEEMSCDRHLCQGRSISWKTQWDMRFLCKRLNDGWWWFALLQLSFLNQFLKSLHLSSYRKFCEISTSMNHIHMYECMCSVYSKYLTQYQML